jgi:O-antigen/teichoic acid export membrane protein
MSDAGDPRGEGGGARLPSPGAGERRVAARGVAWGGIETASGALVGLVMAPLVIRAAGLEGLGLWSAAWSLAHTAGIVDLGVGASYGRFTARALQSRDLNDLNEVLAVGVGFHLTLSLLFGLPALWLAPRLLEWAASGSPRLPMARVVVTCSLLTVLLRATLSAYRGVVLGAQRSDLLGRIGSITTILEGVVGAALLLGGLGLPALAINALVMAIATTLAEARAAHHLCPGLRLRPFRAPGWQYRRMLSFGGRLQLTRAFEILAQHLPRLVLSAGPGLLAAGVYDLGARVAALVQAPASLPLRIILPLAGHLDARGDRARLAALLSRATRYIALLAVPAVALVVVEADTLLHAWTGRPAPAAASAVARLLACALGVALVASPLRLVLRGLGLAGLEAAATGTGTFVLFLLASILVGRFDAPGVALAALAGSLVAAGLLTAGSLPRRDASPLEAARALGPPAAAGVVALALGLLVRLVLDAALSPGAGRLEALLAVLRRGTAIGVAFTVAAAVLGAIRAEDLTVVRDLLGMQAEGRSPVRIRPRQGSR